MTPRLPAYAAVGAIGFLLQIALVTILVRGLQWPVAGATALSVEAAVLHNFLWHERWTWRDRNAASGRLRRLATFHLTNGVTSVAGNVLCVVLLMGLLGLDAVVANGAAVGALALLNFRLADRLVFKPVPGAAVLPTLVFVLAGLPAAAGASSLTPRTLAAWTDYVATVEQSATREERATRSAQPVGREIRIPDGLIHEWRGTVFIANITVSQLVDALTNPGTPPPQEDVVASRVLSRDGDRLRVFLKLVRRSLITVAYDTEHDVTFVRESANRATSRSVATSIVETGGDDHGFLWRLNSYWVYRQHGSGVQVELLSLSLSRDLPALLRPIAGPLVTRVARESMTRTLEAVRRFAVEQGR